MARVKRDTIKERVELLKGLYVTNVNSDTIVEVTGEEYFSFMKRNANKFRCLKFKRRVKDV